MCSYKFRKRCLLAVHNSVSYFVLAIIGSHKALVKFYRDVVVIWLIIASEEMIDYLYQVRYALALLLDNDNTGLQIRIEISIEKFDDIAFSEDGTPKQLIQLKHHIKQHVNLTDKVQTYGGL